MTEECLLTDDFLDGDRLEDEGRVNVVLVDRALDEDHPAVLLVRQKVSHFTRIHHHSHWALNFAIQSLFQDTISYQQ